MHRWLERGDCGARRMLEQRGRATARSRAARAIGRLGHGHVHPDGRDGRDDGNASAGGERDNPGCRERDERDNGVAGRRILGRDVSAERARWAVLDLARADGGRRRALVGAEVRPRARVRLQRRGAGRPRSVRSSLIGAASAATAASAASTGGP